MRKSINLQRLVAILLLSSVSAPLSAQFSGPGKAIPPAPADLILVNGHVYTPGGWATAMAVSHGTIVAIGDESSVKAHRTDKTVVLDINGKTVIPGLHDMHVHPMGAGLGARACNIPHGANGAATLQVIASCAKDKTVGQWITGNGYETAAFGANPPNKAMLDKIAPNNPMLFFDISGHSSWVNSATLKLAGIDRSTPNPQGGIIERDAQGEPTGLLRESASRMAWSKIPAPTPSDNQAALAWALKKLLAFGVTSFDDAGVGESTAIAYAELADKGALKQRVRGCMMSTDEKLIATRSLYQRERFQPTCVKIFLDGVPTDAHTAAMVEDYAGHPGVHGADDGRSKGLLMIPAAKAAAMVTRFDAMGLTVKFHAAGDAAVREGLDAIAAARKTNGFTGQMHNVGHSSFVQMNDIKRASGIAATFEFSPYIWFPSPIIEDIRKSVGAARMARWIPIKDALDAGAQAVPGSDWPVTPSANPWVAIETMVTRQIPGGGGEILGSQERITLRQALDMFTIGAARNANANSSTGSLEVGKFADFLVLDRPIFEIPITSLHQTRVLMTFIGGEKDYDASVTD